MICSYSLWLFTFIFGIGVSLEKLETLYEWKYLKITPLPLKYGVPAGASDNNAIVSKITPYNETAYFNYKKAVPFDAAQSSDGRVFITMVAKSDVRVSLATVSNQTADNGPVLEPYPDHGWFVNPNDCTKFISVWSVTIDTCNRLWVLDTGRVGRVQKCNAKLLVFDLATNNHLKTYEIPRDISENANGRTSLINPVVHTNKLQCDNFNVFIADSEGYALVVFDGKTFHRLDDPHYHPEFEHIRFNIANESFVLPGGIVPMDIDPTGDKVYFAPLASHGLYAQKVSELVSGNNTLVTGVKDVFDSQVTAFRWSINDILFAGLANSSIVCWNRKGQLCQDDFDTVAEDKEKLQYITALKIIPEQSIKNGEEELLVMSNRIQKSINQNRSFDDINFRILKGSTRKLIQDTACEGEVCEECYGTIYGNI